MKQLILALSLIVGTSAFAQEGQPVDPNGGAPGSPKQLSQDAVDVAQVLMAPQVQTCVQALQEKYDISLGQVTVQDQGVKEQQTEYKFIGTAIVGGDVAVGRATLTVVRKVESITIGYPMVTYTCAVEVPERR